MSTVSGVQNSSSSGGISTIMQANGKAMGKEDFLKLLITQLKYQSPLEPMKNEQFVTQLAQFSSLEEIQNLNEKFDQSTRSNVLMAQSIGNSMATTLIGRKVKIQTDQFQLSKADEMEVHYTLSQPQDHVTVEIYDSDGNMVASEILDAQSSGDHVFKWNGEDKEGAEASAGDYKVKMKTTNSDKKEVDIPTYLVGEVKGVQYSDGGAYLMIGGKKYGIGDVLEVMKG